MHRQAQGRRLGEAPRRHRLLAVRHQRARVSSRTDRLAAVGRCRRRPPPPPSGEATGRGRLAVRRRLQRR
eukprot:9683521-Heterocapsa_arctica.AAC.1